MAAVPVAQRAHRRRGARAGGSCAASGAAACCRTSSPSTSTSAAAWWRSCSGSTRADFVRTRAFARRRPAGMAPKRCHARSRSRPNGLGRRWWTDGRCRVNAAIAVLGTIVAAQYLVIGLYVVPRLARLADYRGRLIRLAQWGAAAFFVGCGLTHLGIADPQRGGAVGGRRPASSSSSTSGRTSPRCVGGATFIVIVARKLDVRFAAKDDVSGERARARLAAIVQDSQDAIIAIDARRRVTGWNPGAERLLGYTAEEMVGRPIRDIVPAAEAPFHEAFTGRVLKHGEAAQFEGTRVRRGRHDGRRSRCPSRPSAARRARSSACRPSCGTSASASGRRPDGPSSWRSSPRRRSASAARSSRRRLASCSSPCARRRLRPGAPGEPGAARDARPRRRASSQDLTLPRRDPSGRPRPVRGAAAGRDGRRGPRAPPTRSGSSAPTAARSPSRCAPRPCATATASRSTSSATSRTSRRSAARRRTSAISPTTTPDRARQSPPLRGGRRPRGRRGTALRARRRAPGRRSRQLQVRQRHLRPRGRRSPARRRRAGDARAPARVGHHRPARRRRVRRDPPARDAPRRRAAPPPTC